MHDALNLSEDAIRLLQIQGGSGEAIIECTMRNMTIITAPYICLSYTWEPANPKHDISVNGNPLSVGENLYQFLLSARSAGITQPLWIDALCINQFDAKERTHQVCGMGDIYRSAAKGMIWLGALSDGLIQFLENIKADIG